MYHLVGDSTVADGRPDEQPLVGWGGYLAAYTNRPVRNWAVGGARTETFFANGWWADVLREVSAGDTIVIQFGHNDQKDPEVLASRGGYTDRLRRMIHDAQGAGAAPILCTSVARRHFAGERVQQTHGDYPNAVRDLAGAENVPLIDLNVFTTWLFEDLGPDHSRSLLSNLLPGEYPAWPEGLTDNTHFQEAGARKVAAYVALSLRAIERLDGDQPPLGRDR
ncbi:MAG TPA: rhamnogalacturonan acetylesterase [Microbacterium sp.]|nr:rhamnogalacturonan acetylesterase [Microbacterium sp.]